MRLSRRRRHYRRIENVTLRDIDQVEERTACSENWVGLMRIGRLGQRHCAGSHFVEAIVDRAIFSYVGKRNINRDVSIWPESRLTIRGWQRGVPRISQHSAAADKLHVVF